MTDEQLAEVDALIGEAAEHLANGNLLGSVVAQARLGERASLLRHEVHRLRGLVALHHNHSAMEGFTLGRVCPVCRQHDPEVRAVYDALAATPAPTRPGQGEEASE